MEDLDESSVAEDGSLKVVVHRPYRPTDKTLKLTFLELVLEDHLNKRRYKMVCVGTPRGLTVNITSREEMPVIARKCEESVEK